MKAFHQFKKFLISDEQISLVFFVEKGRTHRRKYRFRLVVAIALLLSTILVLGTISMFATGYLGFKSQVQSVEIEDRKTQLLNYQTQYENLFEQAYGLVEQADETEKTDLVEDSETENWQPNLSSHDIHFQQIKFTVDGGVSRLFFSMENDSGKIQEGFTWALMKIKKKDGKAHYTSAPDPGMVFGKDGSVLDLSLAKTYKFKSRWSTTLDISIPADIEGEILFISLYVANSKGEIKLRQTLQALPRPASKILSH